jgi:Leucine-rich repeat (LRR) protein
MAAHVSLTSSTTRPLASCALREKILITDELAAILVKFPLLEVLSVSGSGLLVIPHTVCTLQNLRNLTLNNNSIQRLDPTCFEQLLHLEDIDLSLNNLTFLPDYIFSKNQNLKSLNVARNSIQDIGVHVFSNSSNLLQLESIDISYNSLQSVDAWPFIRSQVRQSTISLQFHSMKCFTNKFNMTLHH